MFDVLKKEVFGVAHFFHSSFTDEISRDLKDNNLASGLPEITWSMHIIYFCSNMSYMSRY